MGKVALLVFADSWFFCLLARVHAEVPISR